MPIEIWFVHLMLDETMTNYYPFGSCLSYMFERKYIIICILSMSKDYFKDNFLPLVWGKNSPSHFFPSSRVILKKKPIKNWGVLYIGVIVINVYNYFPITRKLFISNTHINRNYLQSAEVTRYSWISSQTVFMSFWQISIKIANAS